MARSKVKSRSHHDVLHQILHILANVPTKYQLPTPYGFRDIPLTRFYRSRSHHDVAHLHRLTNFPTAYQLPTPYGCRDTARQDFIGQGHYSKVKSRSHHDLAHLHPLTNVPTKYQLPTPYGFRDIARTRFYWSRSLRQRQR